MRPAPLLAALPLLACACGASPAPAASPQRATAAFTFAGALSGSLAGVEVVECVPGSYSFNGVLGGRSVSLLVSPGALGGGDHPAVDADGRPHVSLASTGSAGPAGSALRGTVHLAEDQLSGSLDADLVLNTGGGAHVSGSWHC